MSRNLRLPSKQQQQQHHPLYQDDQQVRRVVRFHTSNCPLFREDEIKSKRSKKIEISSKKNKKSSKNYLGDYIVR